MRKEIITKFGLESLTANQLRSAVDRVLLCRQQKMVCAYSGKSITDKMAADGKSDADGVIEIDHIVPMSRSQDNGLNNKVLCYVKHNRGKGNKTPREWLSKENFESLEQRLQHIEERSKKAEPGDYFSKENYARKWENLHRDAPSAENFHASQLTDTAYAARQVVEWLRATLYGGELDGKRRVFTTKGSYTSILRRDWRLFQTLHRRLKNPSEDERAAERRAEMKDRGDHRHHAIDAVAIALSGPETIQDLARRAEKLEIARANVEVQGSRAYADLPRREPLDPPWGTANEFRRQVLSQVFEEFDKIDSQGHPLQDSEAGLPLIIAHRPVKRKLVGALHEETAYGPVHGSTTLFTNRIRAANLTPNHLRRAVEESDEQVIARLKQNLRAVGRSAQDAGALAQSLFDRRQFSRRLIDPEPGKSGIVRDGALRRQLRTCVDAALVELGINRDADSFTKDDMKKIVAARKLRMASGVPIHSVILLRKHKDPIVIPRKRWDAMLRHWVVDSSPCSERVYIGGNNHHIEIRENIKNGKWSGTVVDMFTAASRLHPPRNADGSRGTAQPVVDRRDTETERFIMSLAEGETIYMRHPEAGLMGYFVVFKLNQEKNKVFFTQHWDARPSQSVDGQEVREEIGVVASKLKYLGASSGVPPTKVTVSPLGDVRSLVRD